MNPVRFADIFREEAKLRTISIGAQGFEYLRNNNCFYIDKTDFIRQWWEQKDVVTLITRPRRFGKTLNLDMLNCFFSNKYKGRSDLFEGLSIWKQEEYRQLQGTYPVIFFSFAGIKETTCKDAFSQIRRIIYDLYNSFYPITQSNRLNEMDQQLFHTISLDMDDVTAKNAVSALSQLLGKVYEKKVIILLDEYDTPLQEAYVNGYWDEMAEFIRGLFHATFKTNPCLERAIMTGITRISKESIFSDLNNLEVVTTTTKKYKTSFGFTQEEVTAALDEFALSHQKNDVKKWYDGFTFGDIHDIYNPWSITKFLSQREFAAYWANTSSNRLVNTLIRHSGNRIKQAMEKLLAGEYVTAVIDEEIIFNQLDEDENAIWSLLLAAGYLKINHVETDPDTYEPVYYLELTNLEVKIMFERMFSGWFRQKDIPFGEFLHSMQAGNLREMNIYMSQILMEMVSSFDTANKPSDKLHPERFYHGLVLGLIAAERKYEVRSNGESGYGRYDIIMTPKRTVQQHGTALPSFVIEFKLFNPDAPDHEKTLQDTVERALKQIKEKAYDTAILAQGIPKEQIRHYGFGFEGKKVLIGTD